MDYYESLKSHYPEYISLNQLYQICRISKRSARYLLEHNVIPNIANDNKTWKYRVAIDDVITYLKCRDQWGSMIPRGTASSKHRKTKKQMLKIFSGETSLVKAYFDELYSDAPDALTPSDVALLTGLSTATIRNFIKQGLLACLVDERMYFVLKENLLELVIRPEFLSSKSPSSKFKQIIRGYDMWYNQTAVKNAGKWRTV